MNSSSQDGATVSPHVTPDPNDTCWVEVTAKDGTTSMQNLKHNWQWVWVAGQMTDRIRCGACNKERENVNR